MLSESFQKMFFLPLFVCFLSSLQLSPDRRGIWASPERKDDHFSAKTQDKNQVSESVFVLFTSLGMLKQDYSNVPHIRKGVFTLRSDLFLMK